MRRFLYRATVPPGGYCYRVPETGDELIAGDMAQLVIMTRAIYVRNKITVPDDLSARVEHYICLHVPASFCVGTYAEGDEQHRVVNAKAVREASDLKVTRLKWGPEKFLAPLPLAEQRAATCIKCKLNYEKFCTTCNGLKDYVVAAIGGRTTTLDSRLGVCSVCSCLLKAKIHVSVEALKALKPRSGDGEYPENCWMQKEGIVS